MPDTTSTRHDSSAIGHVSNSVATDLPPEQWEFVIRLRRSEQGPVLASEVARHADLADAMGELWRDECLRKGRSDVAFDQLDFRLTPRFDDSAERLCDGFLLCGRMPCGKTAARTFAKDALADVAHRVQQRLINEKVLGLDEAVSFDMQARHRPPTVAAADGGLTVESRQQPLTTVAVPLPPLREHARTIGETNGAFPVIYTEEALAKSEQFSRRGAGVNPPIETGGVQIGPLAICPETGEFFPIVCNVLEVRDAEEEKFSLAYTSRSWARIQAIVNAMQSQPATQAYRILGQCHGHNFPPAGGAPPCDLCYSQNECHRRSDTASLDDRVWSQAVFSQQSWHLCHIFGSNARNENVHNLFTLHGNRYQARGFYVIPEFNPSAIKQPT